MTEVDKYSTLIHQVISICHYLSDNAGTLQIFINDNDIKMINEKEVYH